jgi:hypothetical protein
MVVVQVKLPANLWLKWADRGRDFDDNAILRNFRTVLLMVSIRSDRMDAAEQEIYKSLLWYGKGGL